MKKKYFFGIFICLILLCSGVFLLATNNFNTIEQIIINDQADAIDIAITVTIDKVYGLGGQYISGATFNITVGREDKNGGSRKGSTFDLSTYPNSSYERKVDASWLANYRYMAINSTTILSGGRYGDSSITTNYGWIESNRGSSGITGFRVRHDTADAYREGSFTLNIYWGIFYNCKYNDGTDRATSFYYSTKDDVAKSKPLIPTRTGYQFKGYYTATSGGTKLVDENGNWTGEWNRSEAKPAQLYAQWEPKDYQVDTNILNPGGVQDYQSGTMTQSYGGQTKTGLTDQAFSDIKADTTLTISNIVPAAGMHVSSITVNRGTISVTKSNGVITGCTYTVSPNNLGEPSGSWDAVISINMDWNKYRIDINFYQPNGSTQEGGTFDLYKKLSGGSETLIQKGLSNEVSGQEYLQYRGQFILKNIMPNAGTYITGASLSSTSDSGTIATSGDPINTITYTANQTGQPSDGWDNAILIYTSTNNVLANLDCQGGIVESSSPSQQYNEDGTYLSLPSPTREGYTFIGWNTADDGSGKYYTSSTNFNDLSHVEAGHCVATANAGNIEFTLYAIWEANDYDVTLNDGSGAVSNLADMPWIGNATVSDSTYSYTSGNLKIDYNAKTKDLKLNGTPTNGFILFLNKGLSFKEGDQFKIEITHKSGSMLSWAGNGYFVFEVCDQNGNNFSTNRQYLDLLSINSLAIGSTYSDTLTINANSAKLGKGLKVWYYAAGTPASQMITNYEVNFKITKLGDYQNANKKVVATYDSPMNVVAVPSKFGHTFNGYFDKVSDGTKYYDADGTSDRNWDKANTATLHAQWTPYSYTLTLEGNGGTTANGQAGITTSGSYTSNLKLQSKPFTRAGYIFKGWSTTKNGAVIHLDGANYSSLITNNNISITLYAQWEETIASDITSTYSTAGTYYINTAAGLAKLIYTTENKAVGNGYIFIQTANIDLSGLTYLPIGRLNSFSGTYDGQGYTISGIRTYNGIDVNGNHLEVNGGLFANAGGAKIKNVIIEDATIYGQNAGIIAGSGNASTKISNCVVSGTVNGTNAGSIIGNGNGASISVCLAKGVNTASFAGSSANVDSCIYELADGTKGVSDSFNNYSAWIYPSNFAYPMPKAFMWYPGAELSESSLEGWIDK